MTTVRNNTLGTIETLESWFARAIEFAERDIEATARARAYHLARTIERGVCPVGHVLSSPSVPINSLGTAPCGYCVNARAVS